MIDQVDVFLEEWIASTLGDLPFSLAPPTGELDGKGVSCYLLELADFPPPRTTNRPPLQFYLRYLITTWAEDPQEAHRMLGELVFAAMENPELRVEFEPPPAATWSALGVTPRPSFILRIPLRRERPEPAVERVRVPLELRAAPIVTLHGVVLGPDDVPVMGAYVSIPLLNRSVRTDMQGRFRFPATPGGEGGVRHLHVRAKGRELDVPVEQGTLESGPIIVRFHSFDREEE